MHGKQVNHDNYLAYRYLEVLHECVTENTHFLVACLAFKLFALVHDLCDQISTRATRHRLGQNLTTLKENNLFLGVTQFHGY